MLSKKIQISRRFDDKKEKTTKKLLTFCKTTILDIDQKHHDKNINIQAEG